MRARGRRHIMLHEPISHKIYLKFVFKAYYSEILICAAQNLSFSKLSNYLLRVTWNNKWFHNWFCALLQRTLSGFRFAAKDLLDIYGVSYFYSLLWRFFLMVQKTLNHDFSLTRYWLAICWKRKMQLFRSMHSQK